MPSIQFTIEGNSVRAVNATNTLTDAIRRTKAEAKTAAATSVESARAAVAEAIKQRHEQEKLVAAYRQVARQAVRGSEEQVQAMRLATAEARKLEAAHHAAGNAALAAGRKAREGAALSRGSGEERGLLRGIAGRGVGFASNAFIAGAVGGLEIKEILDETKRAQISQEMLRNALRNSGISWRQNRKEIEDNLEVQERMSGFDRVALRQSLADISRGTHDLTQAQKELSIATDVARGRHMSLEAATKLVIRAQLGNVGALRRLGIEAKPVTKYTDELKDAHVKASSALRHHAKELDLAATKTAVMEAVQKRYAGASTAYTKTFSGRLDELRNTWRELQIQLGVFLLPALSRFVTWLTELITKARTSKKFHDDLKETWVLLGKAVNVASGIFKQAWGVMQLGVKAVGGVENAVKALFIILAVNKVRGIASAITTNLIQNGLKAIGPAAVAAEGETVAAMGGMRVAAIGLSATIKGALISTGIGALVVAAGLAAELIITHWSTVKKWIAEFGRWLADHAKLTLAVPVIGPFIYATVEIIKHWKQVKTWLSDFWDWLRDSALHAALDAVEPFSHLPGKLGSWARKAKTAIKEELWATQHQAAANAANAAAVAFGQGLESGIAPYLQTINQQIADAYGAAAGGGASGAPGSGAPGGASGAGRGGKARLGFGQAAAVTAARTAAAQPGAGHSYTYGGAGGQGYLGTLHTDCSGFTQRIMANSGVSIGRTSEAQFGQGTPVDWAHLQPGDLVFFNTHDGDKPPSHVGIYVGNGTMIHDNHTGGGIVAEDLNGDYWRKNFMGGRRYFKDTASSGGGASGAPGRDSKLPHKAPPKHTDTSSTDTSAAAFAAELANAPRTVHKKKGHHVSLASAAAIASARDTINEEIDDATKAGDSKLAAALRKIREQLQNGITSKDLAMIRVHMREYAKAIKDELKDSAKAAKDHAAEMKKHAKEVADAQRAAAKRAAAHAKAVVDASRGDFTSAWSKFASQAMEAFNRVTQRHLTEWRKNVSDQVAAWRKDFQRQMEQFNKDTQRQVESMKRLFEQQMKDFDRATQVGLGALAAPKQTAEEKALADFQSTRAKQQHDEALAGLQQSLAEAQSATLGDTSTMTPEEIAAAQKKLADDIAAAQKALDNQLLDDQEAYLSDQAQASRDAADQQARDAQDAYQDQRDALKQALQDQEDAAEQSYQEQRDALAQSLSDAEDLREQSYQDEQEALMANYEDQRTIQADQLQAQLDDLGRHLEARNATWDEANGVLAGIMANGGANVGDAFVQALKDSFAAAGLDYQNFTDALNNQTTATTNAGARPDDRPGPRGAAPPPAAPVRTVAKKAVTTVKRTTTYGGKHSTGGWTVPGADLGRDSVMTMLRPGEYVMSQQEHRELQHGGGDAPAVYIGTLHVYGSTTREVQRGLARAVASGDRTISLKA